MSGSNDGGYTLTQRLSLGRTTRTSRELWYRSRLYHRLLRRQKPTSNRRPLALRATEGNATVGEAVLDGRLPFAGKDLPFGTLPWSVPPPGPAAAAAMHGFGWLLDLKALGTEAARGRAQDLVRGWIRAHPRWHEQAWQPGILGRRLTAWLAAYDFVLTGEDEPFRDRFDSSLAIQAHHLVRAAPHEAATAKAFAAVNGLVAAALCLGIGESNAAVDLLEREVDRQILPDGCHIQRNPALHLAVLRDVIAIRGMLAEADLGVPLFVEGVIERMVGMLRFFRLGDGGLALFNGGKEEDVYRIDATLAEAGVKELPPASALSGRFERVAAGSLVMLVDVGVPPPAGADRGAHAGPGAIEISVGRDRLIVNCGGYAGDDPRWQLAMRSTAAHSAAMIDDVNAIALDERGGFRHGRLRIGTVRREAEGAAWIEVDHDGYGPRFSSLCRRRLYIDALGEDLRGEDVCEGRGGSHLVVRFHLHPRVDARIENVAGGETAVRLALPGGAVYRFFSVGGSLAIDDSVYLGRADVPERTRQIVLTAPCAASLTRIKWALRRVDAAREASEAAPAAEPTARAGDEGEGEAGAGGEPAAEAPPPRTE
ncbi:MAG: heparinase II/III family protein [Rhodospirillales bacterium]|nr:heparinase II/III family protein [Rhodospirillales bacterium]